MDLMGILAMDAEEAKARGYGKLLEALKAERSTERRSGDAERRAFPSTDRRAETTTPQ